MAIGIPVGILLLLLGVAWACYYHRARLSSWIAKTKIQFYRPKNNNIETTELRVNESSTFVIVSTGYPHGLKQEIVLISYRKRGAYLKQH